MSLLATCLLYDLSRWFDCYVNVESSVGLPMVLVTNLLGPIKKSRVLCPILGFLPHPEIIINVCERAVEPGSINQSVLLLQYLSVTL